MEENPARGSKSPSRSASSVDSGVTVESSRRFFSCEDCCNAGARLDDSSGWTNEKHHSYLDYLEMSFVEQLHHSISLHCLQKQGNKSWGPFSAAELPENSYYSADQFSVLREGCWKKDNFENEKAPLGRAADSCILENPWLRHCINTIATHESLIESRHINWVENTTFTCASARNTDIAEASDQNFEDEGAENLNHVPIGERLRRSGRADALSSDQVVPSGNLHRRNEKELLSENPENFNQQKFDLHYFLRGS